jgi:hypothetical protein
METGDWFNYIVRSSSKNSSSDTTSNCSIRLNGLPTQYKEFEVEVQSFNINTLDASGNVLVIPSSFFELRSDLSIIGGYDTLTTSLQTVAIQTNANQYKQASYVFKTRNFNGNYIRFQLYGDDNALLRIKLSGATSFSQYDKSWVLVLKIRGLN